MDFDINEVLFQMTEAVKSTVADNWKEVKNPAKTFFSNRKERLALLVNVLLNGEITQARFDSRI